MVTMVFELWMILIALICFIPHVNSTTITVSNDGTNLTMCCVNGTCPCGSLYYALQHLTSNSIINITSESVTLNTTTPIGSVNLHNITITGNGAATIMCNNSGGVYCESCSDVIIEGITWDKCDILHIPDLNITHCVLLYSNGLDITYRTELGKRSLHISHSRFLVKDTSKCAVVTVRNNRYDEEFAVSFHNSTFNCFQFDIYSTSTAYTSVDVISSSFIQNSSLHVHVVKTGYNRSSSAAVIRVRDAVFMEGCGSSGVLLLSDATNVSISDNTVFINNNGTALYIQNKQGINMRVTLNNVQFIGNKANDGCVKILTSSLLSSLDSLYINLYKVNFQSNEYDGLSQRSGILVIEVDDVNNSGHNQINFTQCKFSNNTGIRGVILHMAILGVNAIPLWFSECNFFFNAGGKSISYFEGSKTNQNLILNLGSSSFIGNSGSSLFLSSCWLFVHHQIEFKNNSAYDGAAIYTDGDVVFRITSSDDKDAEMTFVGNTARFNGGAIYFDLSNHMFRPVPYLLSFSFINETALTFINNSAGSAGNSIYLRLQNSLDLDFHISIMSFVSRLSFNQSIGTVGLPYATSPNKIQLCSSAPCNATTSADGRCFITEKKMLGQSVNFNATICDYFNQTAGEKVQFHMNCVNCGTSFKLENDGIVVGNQSRVSFSITTLNPADSNADDNTVIIDMFSILPPVLKQLSTTVSVNLSSCFGGFKFSNHTKICECYNDDNDIIQCDGVNAEIRQGYWFGSVVGKRTVSLCPNFYCEFSDRTETGNGYYNLPRELDDQCRPHRTGVACGECSSGYTLAYNAPDCVDERKCSWMLPLVIVLTILYWIVIVVGGCGLMHSKFQISLGHLYGIIYYYSIVDVLLGNDLFISDGVFQLVAVISSFAKLTPHIFGSLCFVKGLSGIDQQFINYIHVIAVSILLFGISRAAKYSRRVARFGQHFIIRAVCVLLLLSYTSLASTSLQLLRPLTFNDVDETFSYSSPDVKYFSGRHVVYGIVAILCAIGFVVGFPCLLLLEPFLKQKVNFIKIKPLLDQFQGSFKDKHRWFAAYYLMCRLVIFFLIYAVHSYQDRLYCLQTACVIMVLIHIWIQPYKNDLLNLSDSTILLTTVLVVNLTTFDFTESTTIAILVVLIIIPLCVFCMVIGKTPLTYWIIKLKEKYQREPNNFQLIMSTDHSNQSAVRYNNGNHQDCNHFQESLLSYIEN